MFYPIVFKGIPVGQLPNSRSPGRRHSFSSRSILDYRFGVKNCSSAFCLSERYPIGGGRCVRSQSLQNLSANRENPMFGDYHGLGGKGVLGSCGSFGGGTYGGANRCGKTHRSGYRRCFSGDNYCRSEFGSISGSTVRMGHGEKTPERSVGKSHSRCLEGLGETGDCGEGNSSGKSGGHSGENNGDTGSYGDGGTYSRRDQGEKRENNDVDLGPHERRSGGGSLDGHFERRHCEIGRGRTQRVHISESLHNLDIDPEVQRVRMEETEQIKNRKRQYDSCINKVRILEQRNALLSTQWELLQQQYLERKSLRTTESLFQTYMQDMRMLLNTVRGQKGQLLSELRQLQAVTKDCEKRHKKGHKKRLATENELAALKQDIDTAYKGNMDLGVKTDLLIEQIVCLRGVYEMELTELQRRAHDGTDYVVFRNHHSNLDTDGFLEEVRCQYEEIAERSKEEVDAWCRGKYEELHTMCGIHREHLHDSRQELLELTHHIQTLKMEIGKLKKKNTRLQKTIADSEQRGDHALQDAKEKLHDIKHALQKARDKFTRLQRDFQEQLEKKLELETEITICRKQLERGGCRLNQLNSVHSSAAGGSGGERGAPSSPRNSRNSGGLCDNGDGHDTSEMRHRSRNQGYSFRRGSYTNGSRTYSFGGEEYSSKGTKNSTTRECDQKGMGTSANEVCTLAASGDGDRPGSTEHDSRDISHVEECIKSQTDDRNGGSASGTGGDGLQDSESGENPRNGGQGSRNICSFTEGACSPNTCENRGYSFGIRTGRSRHGSSGNVGLGSKVGAESGTNGYVYRGRPSHEGGRRESIQPPEYRHGYGFENSRCMQSPGNREFAPGSRELGSRGISVGGVNSLRLYESGENSYGSGMCGSEGSEFTGTKGGRIGSGNEDCGSRILSNLKGGVSSSGLYGTRRYTSGI